MVVLLLHNDYEDEDDVMMTVFQCHLLLSV